MDIMTKYFGQLSFEENEIICFDDGLFGFDELHKFALIRFDNENGNMLCLQSLDKSEIAFTIINPFAFIPDYKPCPAEYDLKKIGLSNEKEALFYNVCVIHDKIKESTVNMRCPIVINIDNRKAVQVVLDGNYSFKHPFIDLIKEE